MNRADSLIVDKHGNKLIPGDAVRNLTAIIGFVVGAHETNRPILCAKRKPRKNSPRWVANPEKCELIDIDALHAAGEVFEYKTEYCYTDAVKDKLVAL